MIVGEEADQRHGADKCLTSSVSHFYVSFSVCFRVHFQVFIGALLALSAYQRTDLIQNVFASRPEDFKIHGVRNMHRFSFDRCRRYLELFVAVLCVHCCCCYCYGYSSIVAN